MKAGIYSALVTPFKADGAIDYEMLKRVLDVQIARNVTGFYVCGSTAEVMLLNIEERKKILETVVDFVQGRCFVLAHIGAQYTNDSIELAKHAASIAVDGIASLPPIYYKYTSRELENYFLELADATDIPLIVYNAPSLTGVEFNRRALHEILSHPNIVGIKFTSYDMFNLQRIQATNPDKIIFGGHDELFLNMLTMGVEHAIGSSFNFIPEIFLAIRQAFEAGDIEKAWTLQNVVNEILEVLLQVGVFRGVKAMLSLLGLSVGDCRKPFAPISKQELKLLRPLIRYCKKFC